MVFNRGLLNIAIRVAILTGFALGLAYSYFNTHLVVTPIMFGVLILISSIEVSWFLQRQERNWVKFLQSVQYQDFSRVYQKQASKELSAAYELITQSMEELQSGKQAEYRLLQTVLGHISIGVSCYRDNGEVIFTNKTFNTFLGLPGLANISRVKRDHPKIYEAMTSTEGLPAEWIDHQNGQKLLVKTESFKLKANHYKLTSLTDIRSSLDAKELESYQNLMRVMTHEIMNSTTPILSLIKVVNKKLLRKNKLTVMEEKDQKNVATSLRAIEERTSGMLKFVNAYKRINKPFEPKLQHTHSQELLQSIQTLLRTNFGTELTLDDQFNSTLFIDQALISQVLINLVKNAQEAIDDIKDGQIRVALNKDEDFVVFLVEDNGPGIPEKDLHQIFIPFYTTKNEGSGIGLALSRKIAKAHGGVLEYSRHSRKTQFYMRLPQKANPLA